MQYCLYLRKSRSDIEAEARGEGETLARHEKALLELAQRLNLNVTQIYREIVSGETIAARPVMQQLLTEVEHGVWTGVLVMEVERLARGDTVDQGIVAQTFKYSSTRIITPLKTYNPADEYDEEYFEFGLFMSRREYKTINRRLQRGRMASVKEGKYCGSVAPYGYSRVRLGGEKGWTLEINEEEAEVVRVIFEWYVNGCTENGTAQRLGTSKIAHRLNELGYRPRKGGRTWAAASVRDMLINPVYTGVIRWDWRKCTKKMVNGQVEVVRCRSKSEETLCVKGRHPAIISDEVFRQAQYYMSQNHPRPVGAGAATKNPLSGLVVCGKCGRKMVRRPYNGRRADTLICADPACCNVGSDLPLVESRILEGLSKWLNGYKLQWNIPAENDATSSAAAKKRIAEKCRKKISTLRSQLGKTHDLLEQGVYDTETFLARSRDITQRMSEAQNRLTALEEDVRIETLREESSANIIPNVERVLELYDSLPTAQAKNDILKEVLEKVIYTKEKSARNKGVYPDDIELTLYPKLPVADNE